ncbi:hypothetical protein P12x_000262 [Tundrisphaera lichenicola]|uniref:hypothetical protein n=1 Tax=Tundrisphaera lichenicola TaxID=2029860 RepID=UPI003EBE2674
MIIPGAGLARLGSDRRAIWPILLVALSSISCSSEDAPSVYPVEGRVLFRGKAAEGAQVYLHPRDIQLPGSARPNGVVEPDGSFRISTFREFDGAPPGSYGVSLVWLSDSVQEDGEDAGPDRLRGRYREPARNPWTVVVAPGPNIIEPLELN